MSWSHDSTVLLGRLCREALCPWSLWDKGCAGSGAGLLHGAAGRNLEMPLIVWGAGGFSTPVYSSIEWGFVAGCSEEMGAMRGRGNWLNWNPSAAGLGLGACSGKRFKTWGWQRSALQGFAP